MFYAFASPPKSTSKGTQQPQTSLAPGNAFEQVHCQIADGQADLGHAVAFADGDGLIIEGLEVDGDAEGGADFVLAAVAATDVGDVVVLGDHVALQGFMDRLSGRD